MCVCNAALLMCLATQRVVGELFIFCIQAVRLSAFSAAPLMCLQPAAATWRIVWVVQYCSRQRVSV
jgi:hypothetical protein